MNTESKHAGGNSPQPPSHPGAYELIEELGRGQSGTVYRARLRRPIGDVRAGTVVAIKFLRQELLTDPAARAQLDAEARVGRQVRSDHVVRIHGVETIDALGLEVAYLVMELVEGRTLRQLLLEAGSVVEELARRIGHDAALGLAAIHREGVVHRDIKPENLALAEAGDVKVMDLGLAREVSRAPRGSGSGFYGSLSYAAPEVLRGEPATARSDLYSLGVVLYEIVAGRHPFTPECIDADEVIDAHLRRAPAPPSHYKPRLSAFLEQLILDLLSKDPASRPASASELATAFARGENSRYWLRHERNNPHLASRRRIRAMRRAADAPFVDRRDELRRLDRAMRSADEGRGCAVFVSGPRAMGRRRLLDHWLANRIEQRDDVVFLGGEALGGAGIQRAAPFTDMVLEWFLRGDRPDSPQAQARLAARIAATTTGFDEPTAARLAAIACGTDRGSSPEARADLLARLLFALRPADHTLILRVDLFERLSTTGELVVERLTRGLDDQRVLLLLVSLDTQQPPPGAVHLGVRGLREADFVRLGRQLFADGDVDREVLSGAHATLAGSPGNLLGTLAELLRHGHLTGRVGSYRAVDALAALRPPTSLLDRLHARVEALSRPQRFVHLAAAVLGERFQIADLAALVGQTELQVLEALSVFQDRIIVTQRGRGRFRHRDFRKVIRRVAPRDALRRLHRAAAWTLEDRGAPPLEVGLHLSRASEHAAALQPLLAGLASLIATGSRRSALKVCSRLRIHLGALPRRPYLPQRLRLHLLQGLAEELAHREARAWVTHGKAVCLARVLGDGAAEVDALLGQARVDLGRGRLRGALQVLDRAEDRLLGSVDDPERLARVFGVRARVLGYLGQSDAALLHIREALRTVEDAGGGLEEFRAHLHTDLARLEALRNHFATALKSLDRADRMFARVGSQLGLLRVQLHRGHILADLGSRDQATAILEAARQRAEELHDLRAAAKAHLFLGRQALAHGDPDAAVPHLDAAVTTAPGDLITRLFASVSLYSLGRAFPDLEREIDVLDMPALRIAWWLTTAERDGDPSVLERAVELGRTVQLPLHLHRRLLQRTGRANTARQLEAEIAARLPRGTLRRRFVAFVRHYR